MEHPFTIPFDFATLRVIWWFLLGVLVTGYFIFQGFDMGVGMLLPIAAKSDIEKRIMINTVGPVWEGSQVWLILSAGASFAAWPLLYAVSFSGMYLVLAIVLFAVILRPVGFKFRSRVDHPLWRSIWDSCLFIGAFVPTLLMGVGIGKFLDGGFPFHFDDMLRMSYTGSLVDVITPYSLMWGIACVVLFIRHGALYLSLKTVAPLKQNLEIYARMSGIITVILIPILLILAACQKGCILSPDHINTSMPSNPLMKADLAVASGTWIQNFYNNLGWKYSLLFLWVPALLMFAGWAISFFNKKPLLAFAGSSVGMLGLIATFGALTFPFLLPSSTHLSHSLTVWDTSSSQLTLFIMFIGVVIFMPLILAYTAWVYKVLAGPLDEKFITEKGDNVY